MPRNNFVYLKGRVIKQPFFGYVAINGSDGGEKKPFLQLYLDTPRDRTQPSQFAGDRIRVVMYGDRAATLYPTLHEGLSVSLVGWLQHRVFKRGKTVMEVVAQEMQVAGQQTPPVVDGGVMAQLQDLARQLELDISSTVKALLTFYQEGQDGQKDG